MANPFVEYGWFVQYTAPGITSAAWNYAFKRLYFVQNVRNMPSHATHVFQCLFTIGSQPMQEQLMKEAAQLVYAQTLSFNIATASTNPIKGTIHEHCIVDWALKTDAKGFLLVVKTMDKTILATIESKNRSLKADSIDQMVQNILEDYQISDLSTEPCQAITHFSVLLQRNLTDMQFLINELLPRAISTQGHGGYSLFTKDGSQYYFETLGHTKNVYQPQVGALIYVKEMESNYSSARLGGMQYTVHGFDPFTKKPYISSIGPDVNPSFGNFGPLIPQASRYDYVPLQTMDAVNAWATERQYMNRYEAYPMVAQFRGSVDLDLPMQIDFSQTYFRTTCTQVAPVTQIRHLITCGKLIQTVVFLRDKTTL